MERKGQCQMCGGPLGNSPHKELCQKCINTLPECQACGMVCAPEWGFLENPVPFTLKDGKKITLCGSCKETINRNGYLRVTEEKILLRDGRFIEIDLLENLQFKIGIKK